MEHTNPPDPAALARQAVSIADIVRAAMEEAGVTQRDLATAAGIPLATLNRRLMGAPFIITELDAIARVLGIRTSALVAIAEDAA